MLLGIQIIGMLFVLLMLYLTFLFYKRNTYSRTGFIFWAVVWLVTAVLVLFNETVTSVAQDLQFARATDLYMTIAIMFFGLITFLNYASVRKQERKVEELVRSIALKRRK